MTPARSPRHVELGAYRPAHRASDNRRHIRAQLAVRDKLVRSRAKYVTLAGALLRREGLRVGAGALSVSQAGSMISRPGDCSAKSVPCSR